MVTGLLLAFTEALPKAGEDKIAKMEECVNRLDQSNSEEENAALDKQIHYTLAEASGNTLLLDILEACSKVIDEFIKDMRYEILRTEERKGMLNECHRQLVEAMREKDEEKGRHALKRHFEMIDRILGKQ